MIYIKSEDHIAKMKVAGAISKDILIKGLKFVKAGITTSAVNDYIENLMVENNVTPWFKEVDDYQFASCISINDTLVHGVPSDYVIKDGDLVSIDIGVKNDDAYVDQCWTIIAGMEIGDQLPVEFPKEHQYSSFLKVGVTALLEAINQVKEGNRIGLISNKMQELVEKSGYTAVREYTGHGVGYEPHEDPYIPCYGSRLSGSIMKKNMVFAVEIMYTSGNFALYTDKNDGWSAKTLDKSMSAMFEHTVLVLKDGYQILTD